MPAPLTASSVDLLDTASYHIFSRESVLGIPMRAFAELVIGFLVFGTALQYTGAGAFFINLAVRAVRHLPRRRRQGGDLLLGPARLDERQRHLQRADDRHHDHSRP